VQISQSTGQVPVEDYHVVAVGTQAGDCIVAVESHVDGATGDDQAGAGHKGGDGHDGGHQSWEARRLGDAAEMAANALEKTKEARPSLQPWGRRPP
jgi:hypothetical protein